MQRINLDPAPSAVKDFVRTLPLHDDGVELELDGSVICKVVAPHRLSDEERASVIARGRELVARARQRNEGVSADLLAREVREAIEMVRSRNEP